MTKFEINKTYTTRSFSNHDCIISVTIVKRTEKTVTVNGDGLVGKNKVFRVKICRDAEYILPWGNYSMSPILNAN